MGEPRAGWGGEGSRLGPRGVSPLRGMKKAGGPTWPTAQRFVLAAYRLGLTLGGRRPPAHDRASARMSGTCRCVSGEIAHEHTSFAAAWLADLREST